MAPGQVWTDVHAHAPCRASCETLVPAAWNLASIAIRWCHTMHKVCWRKTPYLGAPTSSYMWTSPDQALEPGGEFCGPTRYMSCFGNCNNLVAVSCMPWDLFIDSLRAAEYFEFFAKNFAWTSAYHMGPGLLSAL